MLKLFFCCCSSSNKRKKLRKKFLVSSNSHLTHVDSSDSRQKAATKIQSIARAMIAKQLFRACYNKALQLANEYWIAEIVQAQMEIERARREKEVTRKVNW